MGQLYGFDEESAGRIVAAVEAVEGAKGNYRPPKYRPPGKANPPEVQDIRVTSATLGANGYPAKIQQVQNGAGGVTYTDLGDCYALDPNSGSLL